MVSLPAAFVIHANLDCEARWAGGQLPGAIAHRVSAYAALLAVLAPEELPVEIWAPAAVDRSRLRAVPGWVPPTLRIGAPPRADLAWAVPDARAANDRRLALAVAEECGVALPGSRVLASIDELEIPGRWVTKAPWTSAGRDRCHGAGAPSTEQRTRITRLLAKFGELVLEPWVDRIVDVGVCARVDAAGAVTAELPHGLITDARGTFLGIDLSPPELLATERTQLTTLVSAAGAALARTGYAGPFAIDAFAYRVGDERRFHPLCEINARYTFGWIARGLASRLGVTRLGFGAVPPRATPLIAAADDGVTAWVE